MIPITQKEYDDLLRVYGPVKEDAPGSEPILTYDFESETEGLMGGAEITEDAETGSKVLSLNGNGAYFEFPEGTFDRRDTFTLLMDVKTNMTGNFLTFAVGSGDTDHYMFFRARNNQLRMAGTISGWQFEHDAATDNAGITGEWARIALVVKPGYYAIYKDGVLAAENDNITVTKLAKENGGGSLLTTSHLGLEGLKAYLGKSFFPDDQYVTGSFDNVALYNRALDAGEILQDAIPDMNDESMIDSDIETVTLPQVVVSDIELPLEGTYGSTISWTSSDESYITADGKVTRPSAEEGDATVTMTATYTYGSKSKTVVYKVTVKAESAKTWNSTTGWSGNSFETVTESAYIEFDVIPNEYTDGFIGIYSSTASPGAWADYNIIIRTKPDGTFDAHNGTEYKASEIKYEPGRVYHVTVSADVNAKTFSAWITDDLGNTSLLAENYSFRSKAGSDLSNVTVRGGDKVAAGTFTVEGFEIKDGPDVKAELGWDGTDFTINFTAAPADSIAVYSETAKDVNIGAELNGSDGLALSTADSNRSYQAQATLGDFTGEACAPVSVYSLVAQAVVDFAFDGQIIADQLEKAKAVLDKGGVYIKDGELTAESAKLMDIDGDTVKLNAKAVKAGLRFNSVKYAIADGATADASVSEDGTYVTIAGLSVMEASVIYLEDVEFVLNIADEAVADEAVSGELDFIEEV
ncbi:MAG: LamG domain-containing protein, partial [Oscillospiraceae bacterium]|nr:LamG domain-containing protein [Oscillospiraceae bacterium]